MLEDLYNSSSDSAQLRRSITSAIGKVSEAAAIHVLVRIARNDPDTSVRRTALHQLGSRKEP
jgi:hypothetical protein